MMKVPLHQRDKEIKKVRRRIVTGSIKDLEKRYNDLVARLQTEVDPKVLSSIIEKADAAKKKLEAAREA